MYSRVQLQINEEDPMTFTAHPQPESDIFPQPAVRLFCSGEETQVVVPEEPWEPEQRLPAVFLPHFR